MHLIAALLARVIGRTQKPVEPAGNTIQREYAPSYKDDPVLREETENAPLGEATPAKRMLTVEDFPVYTPAPDFGRSRLGDAAATSEGDGCGAPATVTAKAGDDCGAGQALGLHGYGVSPDVASWYTAQGFIGYQMCAILAQQWLVDNACSVPPADAVRNGWDVNATDKSQLTPEMRNKLKVMDRQFEIKKHLREFGRFTRVFGIRVALFVVKSDDPEYYRKPFNPDGVTEGSYKGIRQIDPYWMTPMLDMEGQSNPTSLHFYEPEFWVIDGQRYHRSHLVIGRESEPADFLKPTYIFGGVPLTQRIYERVYNAERTANEGPALAVTKRTTVLKADMERVQAKPREFWARVSEWVSRRDNYGVKVIDKKEEVVNVDTSLADLDAVIMNQFQLVASIAQMPATKLLKTSPKGFNATGEFEMDDYHESLESLQSDLLQPLLDRHNLLCMLSMGSNVALEVVWNPVDSMSAEKRANVNKLKVDTAMAAITAGVISPDEARAQLRMDPLSGYATLSDEPAEEEIGMSPENLALLGGQEGEGGPAGAPPQQGPAQAAEPEVGQPPAQDAIVQNRPQGGPANGTAAANPLAPVLGELVTLLRAAATQQLPENDAHIDTLRPGVRSVQPSVKPSVQPSVKGPLSVAPQMPAAQLPKMRVLGLPVVIENPRHTVRKGIDDNGNEWATTMPHHYGYFRDTCGADGDELDVFVGPNPKSNTVFVVNQTKDGEFDEHKVLVGFNTAEEAKAAYMAAFEEGWQGFGTMHQMTADQFKHWMINGETKAPL